MDVLKSFYRKVPKNVWICFASGLIFGVIIHLYMLTHKLPNWDDLNNFHGFGSGIEYGRWLLQYLRPLTGEWSIPAFNGMVGIILWTIAACFIYLAMDMKTVTGAVLTPLMVLSFPAVASTMNYMFTVTCYAMGFLFVCVGVYLYRHYKYGCIPAFLLFVLSLGVYQSYICLAAGMLVMGFVRDAMQEENSFQKVLRDGIKSLITLAVTLISYVIISKTLFPHLTTDRGLDTMGQVNILQLPRLVMRCYKRILEYFVIKPYSFTSPFSQAVNIVVCVMIVVLLIWVIVDRKLYKDKAKAILIVALMLAEPLALASIYILAPETQDATLMMLHQYFFVYIVAVVLMEQMRATGEAQKNRLKVTLYGITAAAIMLVGYRNYLVTNEAYFRVSIAVDRASAYYNRIVMNIESQEGYQYGDQISILGEFYPDPNPLAQPSYDADRFTEFSGMAMENGLLTTGSRKGFLQTYMGIYYENVTDAENDAIKETEEYKAMPIYPAEGSIKRINNVWVVKVHDEE